MSGNHFSSLTKEPPLKKLDETIIAIQPGMTYAELREFAKQNTHRDAPGLIRQRFIQVNADNTVTYDRFLSLVSTHGISSAIVRKTMLFVWAYRDLRVRRFICERVAGKNGKWRVNELVRISNFYFFETEGWLTAPTARKARSNIQFFLEETGIFDKAGDSIDLDLNDGWLFEAAAVAAQHEDDPVVRQQLLDDVAKFLIKNKWNGLVNATESELSAIGANPPEDAVPLEDETLPTGPITPSSTQEWNRKKPKQSDKKAAKALIDLVARERANQSHYLLEQIAADAIRKRGLVPKYSEHMDMYFETKHGAVLMEMKSCDNSNIHAQVRKGVSQLLEYRYVYKKVLGESPLLVLVVETAPLTDKAWLLDYLTSLKIILAWKSPAGNKLFSTCPLHQALKGIVRPPSV